jgi:hypothetical protein
MLLLGNKKFGLKLVLLKLSNDQGRFHGSTIIHV